MTGPAKTGVVVTRTRRTAVPGLEPGPGRASQLANRAFAGIINGYMGKAARTTGRIVNKKAYLNYEIVEKFEAGLVLTGTEVKSLRRGQAELEGAYGRVNDGQCWLVGCKISPYPQASPEMNHRPDRARKLLLHKKQIARLTTKLEQRGFTLVPLRLYFNQRGLAKAEMGLVRGKKRFDKRREIQKRQQQQDIDRSTKRYRAK